MRDKKALSPHKWHSNENSSRRLNSQKYLGVQRCKAERNCVATPIWNATHKLKWQVRQKMTKFQWIDFPTPSPLYVNNRKPSNIMGGRNYGSDVRSVFDVLLDSINTDAHSNWFRKKKYNSVKIKPPCRTQHTFITTIPNSKGSNSLSRVEE